ncbi:MAG: transcriptional regulator, ArsR family [Proteobacteria bacterium]|nr:transcriptional regulator, ArsR family [Pseudomonadota bacterium]
MQPDEFPSAAHYPGGEDGRKHRAGTWSNGEINQISGVIAALAHPLRLSIITLLADGERSVSELCDMLWSSQPNISHHLWILQNRNLVSARKDASRMFYALTDSRLSTFTRMIPT